MSCWDSQRLCLMVSFRDPDSVPFIYQSSARLFIITCMVEATSGFYPLGKRSKTWREHLKDLKPTAFITFHWWAFCQIAISNSREVWGNSIWTVQSPLQPCCCGIRESTCQCTANILSCSPRCPSVLYRLYGKKFDKFASEINICFWKLIAKIWSK